MSTTYVTKPTPTVVETVNKSNSSALDDVSEVSTPKSVRSGAPSVHTIGGRSVLMKSRTEPRLLIRVCYYKGLPQAFQDELESVAIPLSLIVRKGDDGNLVFEKDWITKEVLPRVWEIVEDFLLGSSISVEVLEYLKKEFSSKDHQQHAGVISNSLRFYELGDQFQRLDFSAMRRKLEERYEPGYNDPHWRLYFARELGAELKKAFTTSPLLMNHINMYRLPQVNTPSKLVDVMSAAVGKAIESLDISSKGSLTDKKKAATIDVSPANDVTPSTTNLQPPKAILHRNHDGEVMVSPLTTARKTASCAMASALSSFGRVTRNIFSDDRKEESLSNFAEMDANPASIICDTNSRLSSHFAGRGSDHLSARTDIDTNIRHQSCHSVRRDEPSNAADSPAPAASTPKKPLFRGAPADLGKPAVAKGGRKSSTARDSRHSAHVQFDDSPPGGGGGGGDNGGGGGFGGSDDNEDGDGDDRRGNDDSDDGGYDSDGRNVVDTPQWNIYDRGAFDCSGGLDAVLLARARRKPRLEPDWKEVEFEDKKVFTEMLRVGHFDTNMQRAFEKNFPAFLTDESLLSHLGGAIAIDPPYIQLEYDSNCDATDNPMGELIVICDPGRREEGSVGRKMGLTMLDMPDFWSARQEQNCIVLLVKGLLMLKMIAGQHPIVMRRTPHGCLPPRIRVNHLLPCLLFHLSTLRMHRVTS